MGIGYRNDGNPGSSCQETCVQIGKMTLQTKMTVPIWAEFGYAGS